MNQILTEKYRDHVLVQDQVNRSCVLKCFSSRSRAILSQVIIAEFNETKYFLTVMDLEMDLGQSGPGICPLFASQLAYLLIARSHRTYTQRHAGNRHDCLL
eukprot:SAG31_NODE_2797_length_5081_cov_11.092935_9_plen_101_part_00